MTLQIPYSAKRFLRLCDCFLTMRKGIITFHGATHRFYYPYYWPTATQQIFDDEITPYFEALEDFTPSTILDVGAAEGQFAIVAIKSFPGCSVYAFEPALRQRILLSRNARLNRIDNLVIEPFGLWNSDDVLPFRTTGAESSFAPVSRFKGKLEFPEAVRVLPLDKWVKSNALKDISLVKMDAEGAEIEILEGARETLARFHPRMLVQAYHLREGVRTFERCAEILKQLDYDVQEFRAPSGLLYARSS
jgi:FkbM family methyltransferase